MKGHSDNSRSCFILYLLIVFPTIRDLNRHRVDDIEAWLTRLTVMSPRFRQTTIPSSHYRTPSKAQQRPNTTLKTHPCHRSQGYPMLTSESCCFSHSILIPLLSEASSVALLKASGVIRTDPARQPARPAPVNRP